MPSLGYTLIRGRGLLLKAMAANSISTVVLGDLLETSDLEAGANRCAVV